MNSITTILDIRNYKEPMMDVLASFEESIVNDDDLIAIIANCYPNGVLPPMFKFHRADEQAMFEELFTIYKHYIHEMMDHAGITTKPEMVLVLESKLLIVHEEP